ncbi:MAG: FAD-dependent oxidoreductase, partial [Planctomycetaceae bacterium]
MPQACDVLVIGSGFGGVLSALILQRRGLRVVVVDRARHPRFLIGESSTPMADLVWHDLCQAHQLDRLAPLAEYGSWQSSYPQLPCGLKRGFSYFAHPPQQPSQDWRPPARFPQLL